MPVPVKTVVRVRIDPYWPLADQWIAANQPIGSALDIQYMDLENGISESAGVNYTDEETLGRGEGFKSFSSTGNREVGFTFQFRAYEQVLLGDENGTGAVTNDVDSALISQVVQPSLWLEGLKYPFIDASGISHSPPPVILSVGQLLTLRCVVTECTPTWLPPFEPKNRLPHASEVEITFTAVHRKVTNHAMNHRFGGRFVGSGTIGFGGTINP